MRNIELLLALGALNMMTSPASGGRGGRRNNTDPQATEVEEMEDGSEQLVDPGTTTKSTLAVTDKARKVLVENPMEFTVKTGVKINAEGDIVQCAFELLGTDNVKPGKKFTAIKSNKYSAPNDHGQRALVIKSTGEVIVMPDGTTYGTAYDRVQKEEKALFAIAYFDQAQNSTNPHVRIAFYTPDRLIAPSTSSGSAQLW